LAARCGLVLKDVIVFGRSRTSSDDVLAAVGVRAGQPILACNLSEIQQRLAALVWVKEASVRRFVCGEIHVYITEREPIAIYHDKQKFYLVDTDGVLMDTKIEPYFRGLPILSGTNAEKHAGKMLQILSIYPIVRSNISAMQFVQERRWNLKLSNGVEVKLPSQNVEISLKILDKLIADGQASSGDIRMIDLRLHSRVFFKYSDAAKSYLDKMKNAKKI
jgi:cell division protein FtsQ